MTSPVSSRLRRGSANREKKVRGFPLNAWRVNKSSLHRKVLETILPNGVAESWPSTLPVPKGRDLALRTSLALTRGLDDTNTIEIFVSSPETTYYVV